MKVILSMCLMALMMFYSSFAFANKGCNQVFVARLNFSTDDEKLREHFLPYGAVTEAKIILDRDTGRSRGFGFVTMSDCQQAAVAIAELNQTELDGRTIVVKLSNGTESSPREGNGGYSRGGRGGSGYRDDGGNN